MFIHAASTGKGPSLHHWYLGSDFPTVSTGLVLGIYFYVKSNATEMILRLLFLFDGKTLEDFVTLSLSLSKREKKGALECLNRKHGQRKCNRILLKMNQIHLLHHEPLDMNPLCV